MSDRMVTPVCPVCEKSDRVFKVSEIYTESLSVFNKKAEHPTLSALLKNPEENAVLPSPNSHAFTHLFTPPAGKMDFIRPVHPDIITFVVIAIAVFLLYMVYSGSSLLIYFVISTVVIGLGIYITFRKQAVRNYNNAIQESSGPVFSQEHIVETWMKLYYCSRDGLVIDPERGICIRIDEMKRFLLRGK